MAGRIQSSATKLVGSPLLTRMLSSAHKQGKGDPELGDGKYIIIGIDPGETTGLVYMAPWDDGYAIYHYQLETKTIEQGFEQLQALWPKVSPSEYKIIVVCEDYKVYAWKSTDHSWSKLHTSQFIGAIRLMCYLKGIPIVFQMAGQAKGWATDEKLKLWGLYEPGLKHARDACRHLVTFLFFGKRPTLMVTESEGKETGSWET